MTKHHAIVALVAIATCSAPTGCFGTIGAVVGGNSASTRNAREHAPPDGGPPKHRSVTAWSFAGFGIGFAIDAVVIAAFCINRCHGD